jgi:hypothetical protein
MVLVGDEAAVAGMQQRHLVANLDRQLSVLVDYCYCTIIIPITGSGVF